MSASEAQFCPSCGVTMDLHDGPDSCARADSKARAVELFGLGEVR